MTAWRFRTQASLVGAVIALFLAAGAFGASRVSQSIDELIAATASARLQAQGAEAIFSALKDAETGQRGFLLTGRAYYLEPYYAASSRIGGLLDRLAALGQGSPLEPSQVELNRATRAKFTELQRTIELGLEGNFPAALALVNSDAGKATMDQVRQLIVRIVDQAEAERASRAAILSQRQKTVGAVLLTGLAAGVLLLGFALLLVLYNRTRLMRARAGELRQAARLHAAIEHVPDGMAVFDRDGRLTVVNERFVTALGIDAGLATPGTSFETIAASVALVPPVLEGRRPTQPTSSETKAGDRVLVVWRSPMPEYGQMLAVSDVTRRVAAEEAARQSQKMEVLGQMTGGVAHDFNNLLQVVSANLELLRLKLDRGGEANQPLVARLDAAASGVARGARLTRHLLAFARRQPLAPQSVDAARLLTGMEEMLRRTVGEQVELELVLGGSLWSMRADPVQFENALLNLAINARDAMTGPDGLPRGKLTVEAANAALDEAYAAGAAEVSPGQYVMFAITDTGSGMTAAQVRRSVEPFYTTKPEGRGTGLGLPMVLGFAKQSGGHFQLYSEPGRGTTARIYIPRTRGQAEAASAPQAPASEAARGQGELVLLVEDDPPVRQVAHDALLGLGYRVIAAESADAALALLEAGCEPRLLFTDVVMPGKISARDMARAAKRRLPGLGVLFTSGYTQNSIVHNGQLDPDVALISKPWRQEDLARSLRAVLGGAPLRAPRRPRILLVEDDSLVRSTTADALAGLGYDVLEAQDAPGALARLQPTPDLLLTDLGLPGKDGLALVQEVRRVVPDLPAIVSSGHSTLPARPDVVWLAKPYDVSALRLAIAAALG